jgi:hypothetical protein
MYRHSNWRRYITAKEFLDYCGELNIAKHLHVLDLRRFQQEGILVPVARELSLDESSDELESQPEGTMPQIKDSDLWHPFDLRFERGDSYLLRPTCADVESWESFDDIEHYYHYWQAYQLYLLQKRYPIFVGDVRVLERLRERAENDIDRQYVASRWPREDDPIATLNGMATYFDALSFYFGLSRKEEDKAFATVPEVDGYRSLDGAQYDAYQARLVEHAQFTQQRFGLTTSGLYQFLVYMLNLKTECEEDERMKLADELREDILFLSKLIADVTRKSDEEVAEEIEKVGGYWVKQEFRHLHKGLEVMDYARRTLGWAMEGYNQAFRSHSITKEGINELLEFLAEHELFYIPNAIYETEMAFNSHKAFHKTSLYNGMRQLAVGMESFIREIYKLKRPSGKVPTTLEPLIRDVYDTWYSLFSSAKNMRIQPGTPNEFITNIRDVLADVSLDQLSDGPIVRQFLVFYWTRNLTGHHHTLSDELLYGLRAPVFTAMYHTLFYAWMYARQQGWIV